MLDEYFPRCFSRAQGVTRKLDPALPPLGLCLAAASEEGLHDLLMPPGSPVNEARWTGRRAEMLPQLPSSKSSPSSTRPTQSRPTRRNRELSPSLTARACFLPATGGIVVLLGPDVLWEGRYGTSPSRQPAMATWFRCSSGCSSLEPSPIVPCIDTSLPLSPTLADCYTSSNASDTTLSV